MVFWLNGRFLEERVAIDTRDRGFLLGDGVFETLLVCDGVPAFLDAHVARLKEGLTALEIKTILPTNIGGIIQQLSVRSGCDKGQASARITVTRGASERGLQFPAIEQSRATLLITMNTAPQGGDYSDEKIRLIISKHRRSEKSITSRHKTLNYLDNLLARNEALDAGVDDAVMLNGGGDVACSAASNIFLLDDAGVVVTPSVGSGALPGTVRKTLLEAAGEADVEISEAAIEASALQGSYLVLTNSLMGVRGAYLEGQNQPWPEVSLCCLRLMQTWYDDCLSRDLTERAKLLSRST